MTSKPSNMKLYLKIKQETIKDFEKKGQRWPSIIGSSELVRRYKAAGGKYSGKKPTDTGMTRWYKEKWINVCDYPKKTFCGRTIMTNKYPKCRPLKRITKNTPMTVNEIIAKYGQSHLKKMCKDKRKHKFARRPINI